MYKLIMHGVQSSPKIESMHTHSKAGAVAKQESCKTPPGDIYRVRQHSIFTSVSSKFKITFLSHLRN